MKDLPDNVRELVPGRLYAVTGYLPADANVSWIPPGLSGVLGVSCYVVRDGTRALLVDTGLAVHRAEITAGLAAVFDGTTSRGMIMTRREPDAIINLPWLVERFGLDPVYCGGVLNPLDFFERIDEYNAAAHIHAVARAHVTWVAPGSSIEVGALRAEVVRTRLCVLPKKHVFERTTATLFGSDSWGAFAQDAPGRLGVLDRADPKLRRDALGRYLGHKFDWLMGIDTRSVADDVAALADLAPQRICSSSGCVIEGLELVRATILETAEAIASLARRPLRDRLAGMSARDLRHAARSPQAVM